MNDIDILMSHVADINAKTNVSDVTDNDILVLISYYRHQRARRASGYKPAKLERPKVDVLSLLNMTPRTPPKPTAPSGPGPRRL